MDIPNYVHFLILGPRPEKVCVVTGPITRFIVFEHTRTIKTAA